MAWAAPSTEASKPVPVEPLAPGRVGAATARWIATLALSYVLSPAALAARWEPIPPEELAAASPRVQADADAEVLYWEFRAEDVFQANQLTTAVSHHLRIRVFTERGRETWSRVDISHDADTKIHDIEARTVLPGGNTIEVKRGDIFERTLVRTRGTKVQATSFTFPGVVLGAILEYRWNEVQLKGGMNTYFDLQRDLPVQKLVCRIKPILMSGGPAFRYIAHNAALPPFQGDASGYQTTTLTNVPAFRHEPMMPPEIELRSWLATYYVEDRSHDPDQFWRAVSRTLYERDRKSTSTAREMRRAATRIAGDVASDDEKLNRLYEFCRRDIRNLSRTRFTADERLKLRWPKDAQETLERGEGSGTMINQLLASLAASLGYDARIARLADRERTFFRPATLLPALLSAASVAVRVGGGWRFFDPAASNLPSGMLRWQEEGQTALLPDATQLLWVTTPRTPRTRTRVRRTGSFVLLEDGTLAGPVSCEYDGHLGIRQKEDYAALDSTAREEELRSRVREDLPSAELSAIRFENIDGSELPVVVRYYLQLPAFAQATGSRLIIRPAVFQQGKPALFTDERRTHPIDFRYAWSEFDSLLIQLPDGYTLDHAEAPARLALGESGAYAVRIGVANEGSLLIYRRDFWFDQIRFGREQYDALREGFEALHERDDHGLAIRRAGTAGD